MGRGQANISFVFSDDGLQKIQIWAYEGQDEEKAIEAWSRVATYLRKQFGAIAIPANSDLSAAKNEEITAFLRDELTTASKDTTFKLQMGVKPMPEGAKVYASFFREPRHGYFCFLYFTRL